MWPAWFVVDVVGVFSSIQKKNLPEHFALRFWAAFSKKVPFVSLWLLGYACEARLKARCRDGLQEQVWKCPRVVKQKPLRRHCHQAYGWPPAFGWRWWALRRAFLRLRVVGSGQILPLGEGGGLRADPSSGWRWWAQRRAFLQVKLVGSVQSLPLAEVGGLSAEPSSRNTIRALPFLCPLWPHFPCFQFFLRSNTGRGGVE